MLDEVLETAPAPRPKVASLVDVDPFTLSQPTVTSSETIVADPHNAPGYEWRFRLRPSLATGFHKAQSMTAVLTARYLTGAPGFARIPFPAVGGRRVEVSEDLFEMVGQIWAQQVGCPSVPALDEIDARWKGGWSAEQIIAMAAVAPGAWAMLIAASTKVLQRGNASMASVGNSSGSASDTSEATPNTSHEATDCSGQSTTGSET